MRKEITLELLQSLKYGTDRELLETAVQSGDAFVDIYDTYTWYRAIGTAVAPRSILELGVRFGYSAIAMIKGAQLAGVQEIAYTGLDAEVDGIESNVIAAENIERVTGIKPVIIKVNTSDTQLPCFPVCDIVHVDGDHSVIGIATELVIAEMFVSDDGIILVDDCDAMHIGNAVDALCRLIHIPLLILPTVHSLSVIDLKQKNKEK